MNGARTLPDGYRHIAYGDIDSTNTEAFRLVDAGAAGNLWLTCERQTIGRGRGGRSWTSEPGNLYATLLTIRDIRLATALELPFVAGVAIHDAIIEACPDIERSRLTLKWPNDLLLDDQKICGILVESREASTVTGLAVALGFGVNVAHHPEDTRAPATHLGAHGLRVTPDRLFIALSHAVNARLDVWRDGAGFDAIRDLWCARALPVGRDMSVSQGDGRVHGTFAGLDVDGALLLNVSGNTRRILFGDVMFPASHDAPPQHRE